MDFTYFIQNKERIECGEKPGLYCVAQSHIPKEYFAYRCGLAGRNVDSATQFQTKQGNFASRFAIYLSAGFLPTNAKVFACLTVPRRQIQGFAEKVMPERQDGDNREDFARMHLGSTLIEIREKQYHANLVRLGMQRLGMPWTEENRKRGEFFRGELKNCIEALKQIGTGDLHLFQNNDINKIQKITLRKRGVSITPDQVELRTSPRFSASEELIKQMMKDTPTQISVAKLAALKTVTTPQTTRKSPRLQEIEVVMDGEELDRLRRDRKRARTTFEKIAQVRRSPRFSA